MTEKKRVAAVVCTLCVGVDEVVAEYIAEELCLKKGSVRNATDFAKQFGEWLVDTDVESEVCHGVQLTFVYIQYCVILILYSLLFSIIPTSNLILPPSLIPFFFLSGSPRHKKCSMHWWRS